jgi:hypothetical protein
MGLCLAAFVAVALTSVSCSLSGCGSQLLSEVPSPDRVLKAVIFERDCGATTGFTTQVSILPRDNVLPNETGNVFIAGDNHGRAVGGLGGGPKVDVKWTGPRELLVVFDARASTTKVAQSVSGVKVTFQEQTP